VGPELPLRNLIEPLCLPLLDAVRSTHIELAPDHNIHELAIASHGNLHSSSRASSLARTEERVDLVVSMLLVVYWRSPTPLRKRVSRDGSEECEDFEVVDRRESVDLLRFLSVLVLGLNNEAGVREAIFGRVVDVEVVREVVVVLMMDVVVSF
jgi:hypothetical protein